METEGAQPVARERNTDRDDDRDDNDLPRGKKSNGGKEETEKFITVNWHVLGSTLWYIFKWPLYILGGLLALVIISTPGCIYGRYTAPNDKQTTDTELKAKYEKLQEENKSLTEKLAKVTSELKAANDKLPKPKASTRMSSRSSRTPNGRSSTPMVLPKGWNPGAGPSRRWRSSMATSSTGSSAPANTRCPATA